jgi:hypothetical protein
LHGCSTEGPNDSADAGASDPDGGGADASQADASQSDDAGQSADASQSDDANQSADAGVQAVKAICPADFGDDVLRTYTLTGDHELPAGDQIVTSFWTLVSAPPGHNVIISSSGDMTTFFADVVGDYVFEFFVQSDLGQDSCQTIFTAGTGDLLRIEMFWNPDYDESQGPRDSSDFDLYLLRDQSSGLSECIGDSDCPGWDGTFPNGQACNNATNDCEFYYYRDDVALVSSPRRGLANEDSCHWRNCATCPTGIQNDPTYAGHECQNQPDSELVRECLCRFALSNPPANVTAADVWPEPVLEWHPAGNVEPALDPRLDLDDSEGKGPENINVRTPEPGTYRVAVHFFNPDGFGEVISGGFRTSPAQVRILCDQAEIFASEQVTLRSPDGVPFGHWQGDLWEVGDLTVSYNAGMIICQFEEFGTDVCRRICTLEQSDGGCSESERRACD